MVSKPEQLTNVVHAKVGGCGAMEWLDVVVVVFPDIGTGTLRHNR